MKDKRNVVYNDGNWDASNCLSLTEFNNRLPDRMISNGDVRNIKKEISRLVNEEVLADKTWVTDNIVGMKANSTWIRTSINSTIDEETKIQETNVDSNLICEVQIRWLDGSQLYVRMYSTELISDLKRVLDFSWSLQ